MSRAPNLTSEAALAFNKANAAFRAGRLDEASIAVGHAIAAAPELAQAQILRARILRRQGQEDAARDAYDAALALDPVQFDALLERGNVLRALAKPEAARADYAAAMKARPQDTRPALALARLEEESAATEGPAAAERAAVAFQQALDRAALDPDPGTVRAQLCRDIARYRQQRADLPRALEALRQARLFLARSGRELAEWIDLETAEVLLRLGMTAQAQRALETLSASSNRGVLEALAHLAYRFNFWGEAVAILTRAAELAPEDPQAWLELAQMQTESWLLEEALVSLARAEAAGEVPRATSLALHASIQNRSGDAAGALALYDQLIAEGHEAFAPSAAMCLLYADHVTPADVAARHRALFAHWGEGARDRASFGADPDPDRPLRVGMVTGDLHHQHPVNIFLQPLLARWNHEALPLTVYFTGTTADDQTRLARARVRNWREVTAAQLPRHVAADRIDILIDLAGHTAGGTLRQFARRMAPVQASFLGYPGSTGVPNVDWLIGDAVVTPPEADHLCSERVMRLPHTVFCFAPEVEHPLPAPDPGRLLTFGSFNNIPKLTPRTLRLWAHVLAAVPDARLLLRAPSFKDASAVARFRDQFARLGVAADRLVFRGPVGLDTMMQAYAEVDIALDPVPYGGGTTTLQALWMGVPVVTLKGGHFVSRMGASFMTAAGLPEWIALDEDAYVARAVAAASDRPALNLLKQCLRTRQKSSPAWNPDRYAADFAMALREVWNQTKVPS